VVFESFETQSNTHLLNEIPTTKLMNFKERIDVKLAGNLVFNDDGVKCRHEQTRECFACVAASPKVFQ
jgi:hypothetical protein